AAALTTTIVLAIEIREQLRPLDAAFDGDAALVAIERDHAIEIARIDEHHAVAELLAAHRMPAARDRDRRPRRSRVGHRLLQRLDSTRLDDAIDARRIELRVHVVDERAGLALGN